MKPKNLQKATMRFSARKSQPSQRRNEKTPERPRQGRSKGHHSFSESSADLSVPSSSVDFGRRSTLAPQPCKGGTAMGLKLLAAKRDREASGAGDWLNLTRSKRLSGSRVKSFQALAVSGGCGMASEAGCCSTYCV